MAIDNIVGRVFKRGQDHSDAPAYFVKANNAWVPTNYGTYANEIKQAAKALIASGFKPGDTTAILGYNRPEWVIFDLGTMAAAGAPAGIYTTCSPSEVQYIISHAESGIVLVENESQWEKIRQERSRLPKLRLVVMMEDADKVNDPLTIGWNDFIEKGNDIPDSAVDDCLEGLTEDQTAAFIYTSGTTGPPKAVMLSHKNITWTADCAHDLTNLGADDYNLSYLPLSHIAEQMFSIYGPITNGGAIYFAESLDHIADNLKEIQPTIVFGVPRIWEKFYAGVSAKLKGATGIKAALVKWAMSVGTQANSVRNEGGTVSGFLGFKYGLANKLIFSKLKPAIGLGNAKLCVSGAAPIAKEILEFFASLDIVIHEVYGQSEDCGPTSFNVPGATRFGSVGKKLPGIEVKIADDGEILVKGPNVFKGYYKDEAATNDALIDGWLYSGDLGEFDSAGYLSITGRKKDIIITAGGKNIAPKNIEGALKNTEFVSEAVVIGDRRKFLSCLITLDEEATAAWAEANGHSVEGAHENSALVAELQKAVDLVNKDLAKVEQVKKFTLLSRQFTIEDGELTPTLKVKRKIVNEHFTDEIEAMYA